MIKIGSFFEEHIEKVVFGIVGLAFDYASSF